MQLPCLLTQGGEVSCMLCVPDKKLYRRGHQPLCNWELLLGYR